MEVLVTVRTVMVVRVVMAAIIIHMAIAAVRARIRTVHRARAVTVVLTRMAMAALTLKISLGLAATEAIRGKAEFIRIRMNRHI